MTETISYHGRESEKFIQQFLTIYYFPYQKEIIYSNIQQAGMGMKVKLISGRTVGSVCCVFCSTFLVAALLFVS